MEISRQLYDNRDETKYIFKVPIGINEEVVRQISKYKKEPEWMLKKRLQALKIFQEKQVPTWGPDLSKLDLNKICFYAVADAKYNSTKWEDVPENIKQTFERLGIPEAERKALAGAGAQFDSQTIYHNLKEDLKKKGVIFEDMHVAVEKYPELVKKYFMTQCVSPALHKYAALHGAVWSGGTFIYVPKGVKVNQPLQAYFRMNESGMGQFEHTLIIVEENAECHYIEGCFTKGTLIITDAGYKKIEDVTEKDKVLTHEGEYRKVKDLQKYKHEGELYEIEYYGDSTQKITATPEHPFLFAKRKTQNDRNKEFELEWNIPKYMEKKDYLAMPINQVTKTKKERTFEVKKWDPEKKFKTSKVKVKATPEFYRLIGYYLSEGSTMKEHYLCFDFNKKERTYIDDVKKCLKKVFKVEAYEVHHKKNNGTSVRVNSTELARIFKQFGDRNYNKQVPPWMLTESHENQKQIILGWFRGDGNYYNKKHESGTKEAFRINTTSKTMTRQIRDILLRQGIFAFINKRNRKKENRRTIYTLGITGEHMVKFGNLVGIKINKTINNHKRASMFGIDKKFAYVPIKKITKKKTKNKEVYNFGVEGHETYTAGSVIVHNCSAPKYKSPSIHAGCVEVIVHKGARMRYSSVENWSRNTYNLNTKRANVYEEGIMEWVSGNLGCLAGDTKISTNPKGPTKIMELKPGDYVYALNEKTNKLEKAKIKQKIYSGDKKTYRLKAGGREIEATGNHPFLALTHKKNNPNHKKGFFRTEWKKLEDLKKGDLIAIAKSLPVEGIPYKLPSYNYNKQVKSKNQYTKEFSMSINHLYKKIKQPKETNEDLMWLLGILLGDGHIYLNKKNAKINIAIPEKDSLRKEVKTAVKKLFHIDVKYEKDRFLVINSRPLADLIIKIGFSGKADTKKIPPWVHKLPKKQKMALLAGYIDSDGHIGEGGAYITSINKEILEDIQEIALSCGIGFSNVFVHGKKRKTKILGIDCNANDSYRILLNGKNVKEIPIKNKEKKEKLKIVKTKRNYVSSKGKNFRSKTTDEIGFTTIKDIIPTGIKPTFDIEVEKHHNFVAEGMIVHNSGITMLYPASLLLGRKSQGHHVTIAYAGPEQNQDTGAKIYHLAPDTTSTVKSKSISKDGGITAYRGIVEIKKGATNAKCSVHCDAMMFDNKSQSNTYPTIKVEEKDADMVHEATIGKISEDQIFYLMSRGLSEEDALKLIVSGFIEPLMKELPLEYAIEMNKLIQMEMEGSLG